MNSTQFSHVSYFSASAIFNCDEQKNATFYERICIPLLDLVCVFNTIIWRYSKGFVAVPQVKIDKPSLSKITLKGL